MLANHYDVFVQQYDVLGKLSSQWAGDECCSKNVGMWCRKGGWTYLNGRVGSNCIFERIQNCQASCIMECWPSTCCCFYSFISPLSPCTTAHLSLLLYNGLLLLEIQPFLFWCTFIPYLSSPSFSLILLFSLQLYQSFSCQHKAVKDSLNARSLPYYTNTGSFQVSSSNV